MDVRKKLSSRSDLLLPSIKCSEIIEQHFLRVIFLSVENIARCIKFMFFYYKRLISNTEVRFDDIRFVSFFFLKKFVHSCYEKHGPSAGYFRNTL